MGVIKEKKMEIMEMVDDITTLFIKEKYGDDAYKSCGFHLKDDVLDEFQELFDQVETIVLKSLGENNQVYKEKIIKFKNEKERVMSEATLYLLISLELNDTRAKSRDCRRIIQSANSGMDSITMKIAVGGLTSALGLMEEVYPEQVLN